MGNICCTFQQIITDLKKSHQEEIDYLKSMHYEETLELQKEIDDLKSMNYEETVELHKKVSYQEKEIQQLKLRILELEKRSDQILLDYYNLEQNYFKCQNELNNCTNHLDSFTNIFSL